MAVIIRRIEEPDEVENFDRGDEPLKNYLKRHAWNDQENNSIGVAYVAVDESALRAVFGYCCCIITDAYRDRISWYAKYGFVPIEGGMQSGPQRMFLDLRTIRAALGR